MKTNEELQNDVQNAIKWEPTMHAAEIGVTANNGIVTLSGTVDSYTKKINAERAAKNVIGVRALAEDIIINFGNTFAKNDTEIAKEILDSWKTNWAVPDEKIKVKVEDGWVKLDGIVEWNYQKDASQKAINNLGGIKGVTNLITVQSVSQDSIEKNTVQDALKRNWSINSNDIRVDVNKNHVKLSGLVRSLYQKDEASRLAWNAPGVCSVDNELAVLSE